MRRAGELRARTLIFDVEPLAAYWDGGHQALDQGIARVLTEVAALPNAQVVCFATSSQRRPSVELAVRASGWCTWPRLASRCAPRRITAFPDRGW